MMEMQKSRRVKFIIDPNSIGAFSKVVDVETGELIGGVHSAKLEVIAKGFNRLVVEFCDFDIGVENAVK
jgi:hypothetical protein